MRLAYVYQIVSDDEFEDVYVTTESESYAKVVLTEIKKTKNKYAKYKVKKLPLNQQEFDWLFWPPDIEGGDWYVEVLPQNSGFKEKGVVVIEAETLKDAKIEFKASHGVKSNKVKGI